MPELPDVETFRRYIDNNALHKKISKVQVENKKVLSKITESELIEALSGRKMEKTTRHGKHLMIELDNKSWMMMHFGMTGSLKYYKDDPGLSLVRILFSFDNGYHLAYIDQRLFGRISLNDSPEEYIKQHELGPDLLSLKEDDFVDILSKHNGGIKSVLMDQSVIAGLGNDYSDEILYHAGIHPNTKLPALSNEEFHELYKITMRVINVAIDNEANPEKMPDDYLLPHRKKGEPCPKCGGTVSKIYVNGRTTYFCSECQKVKG